MKKLWSMSCWCTSHKSVWERLACRVKEVLKWIHASIYRPMQTTSFSNAMYFLLFVNEFSRKMSVSFLKLKYEFFNEFKIFKAFVENQSKKNIKILRSKNGREFFSKDFLDLCTQEGIQRKYTTFTLHGKMERYRGKIIPYENGQVYLREQVCSLHVLSRSNTHISVYSQPMSNKGGTQEDSKRSML